MSRDEILQKIDRANSGRASGDTFADAAALVANPDDYRADFANQSDFDRFVAKATSETVTATVEVLECLARLPDAVISYLTDNNLDRQIALQPRSCLTELDWAGIQTVDTARTDELVAVTMADAAIAETGSLVFRSGADAPVLLNFLPLHHLAVLRIPTIKRYMEDVFDNLGTGAKDQKRSLNIITGTSGTADIEARNVRGAHGPRFMRIFCISE